MSSHGKDVDILLYLITGNTVSFIHNKEMQITLLIFVAFDGF